MNGYLMNKWRRRGGYASGEEATGHMAVYILNVTVIFSCLPLTYHSLFSHETITDPKLQWAGTKAPVTVTPDTMPLDTAHFMSFQSFWKTWSSMVLFTNVSTAIQQGQTVEKVRN